MFGWWLENFEVEGLSKGISIDKYVLISPLGRVNRSIIDGQQQTCSIADTDKGIFKYYIIAVFFGGGLGCLGQNSNTADALEEVGI